jgi:DNA polymerase-3 subunit alpha
MEQLRLEFEAIGFYLSSHPLDQHAKALDRLGVITHRQLLGRLGRGGTTRFKLAGIVTARQERTSAKGNRFAFLSLSDLTGSYDVTVFSELLAMHRDLMVAGQGLVLTVDVDTRNGDNRLTCAGLERLDKAVENAAAGLRILVDRPDAIARLREILSAEKKGRGEINVVITEPAREIVLKLPGAWAVSGQGRSAIRALTGVVEVAEI